MKHFLYIVIDTNIFEHANNKKIKQYYSSNNFLKQINIDGTTLCVDEGFSDKECENRSRIMSEYYSRLAPGTAGYNYLMQIVQNGKVMPILNSEILKYKRPLAKKIRDRIDLVFLCAAIICADKTLVTNDYCDFPQKMRDYIGAYYKVKLISSIETI
jgi:hypothetical protein